MPSMKRFLQVSVFSLCILSPEVVSAMDDSVMISAGVVASNSPETPESPPLQERADFGHLFMPKPTNLSCTATWHCPQTGGTPVSCIGTSTCSSGPFWWVTCDGQRTFCTCNPSGMADCVDPIGFCNCYNQYKGYNQGVLVCMQSYCD
jgi:hypothetical protein